ncbi:M48 family metallopeptidase [Rossellomorea vietnamensis]|uniref:M48 family metallopeptidase n=1 Tax=Rossellomorea vietnamensis TaxID=218284 RepID=UPI001E5245A7|nr:M48 family metallopeptidase [Rossellomorea vietnamensis]MCC5804672.1 M48 family metallopeptidase [Rossellomorea vietnamensis]
MIAQQWFSHALEAEALEEVENTLKFRDQMEDYYVQFEEKKRRPDLLGKTVKITKNQFPDIYSIASKISEQISAPIPEMFVYEDFYYAMDSKGIGHPWIEISASLLNDFTRKEVEFMLAREMCKLQFKHTHYKTLIDESLVMLTKGYIPFSDGVIEDIAKVSFYRWNRLANYSADCFGYLVCNDIEAAVKAVIKCVLNSEFLADKINVFEYVKQAEEINALNDQVYEFTKNDEQFPYGPFRVKYLMAYASSERAITARKLIKDREEMK